MDQRGPYSRTADDIARVEFPLSELVQDFPFLPGSVVGHVEYHFAFNDQNSVFDLKRGNVWSKLDSLKREPG